MTETLANGYSSESTQRELSNENQHDRVKLVFTNLCILVVLTKVALALEGLSNQCPNTYMAVKISNYLPIMDIFRISSPKYLGVLKCDFQGFECADNTQTSS